MSNVDYAVRLLSRKHYVVWIGMAIAALIWVGSKRIWWGQKLPSPGGLSMFHDHMDILTHTPIGEIYGEWFTKYGRTLILRVKPLYKPVIMTSDPALIKVVHRNIEAFEGNPRLCAVASSSGMSGSITCASGERRQRLRRMFETAFSMNAVRDVFPNILETCQAATEKIQQMEKKYGSTHVAIVTETRRYMIDTIGKCIFGQDWNSIQTGQPSEVELTVGKFYKLRPKATWWETNGPLKSRRGQEVLTARHNVGLLAKRLVGEKKQRLLETYGSDLKREDMTHPDMDLLTRMCLATIGDAKTSQQVSDEDLAHNVPITVIASTDVTVAILAYTFHRLATNPAVQNKLRQELLTTISDNPTVDDILHLPYLKAVIEECMRLDGPYVNIERTATQTSVIPLKYPVRGTDGKSIESITVEKGTQVWMCKSIRSCKDNGLTAGVALRNIHRDTSLYGDDVQEFRPERFLDGTCPNPGGAIELATIWGATAGFSGGSRGCPVYYFPLAAMSALIFTFVKNFEISVPEGQTMEILHGKGGVGRAIRVNGKVVQDVPLIFSAV